MEQSKINNKELEACCSLNCGTNLCPKQVLVNKLLESHAFEDKMNVFIEMKADGKMSGGDKPYVLKKALNLLLQKAETKEQLEKLLQESPAITHPMINFEEIRQLILSKMQMLEAK